jgi:hypothetical protein
LRLDGPKLCASCQPPMASMWATGTAADVARAWELDGGSCRREWLRARAVPQSRTLERSCSHAWVWVRLQHAHLNGRGNAPHTFNHHGRYGSTATLMAVKLMHAARRPWCIQHKCGCLLNTHSRR